MTSLPSAYDEIATAIFDEGILQLRRDSPRRRNSIASGLPQQATTTHASKTNREKGKG